MREDQQAQAMTPAARTVRHLRTAAVGLLSLAGCLRVETEIVDASHSVRLCGSRFTEDSGDKPMSYRWDGARKAYVDPEVQVAVRFGHLQGDAYVVQMHSLRPDPEAPPGKSAYVVAIVHANGKPLLVVSPRCDEMSDLARGYGVEVDENEAYSKDVVPAAGTRPGVIGLLAASLNCPPPAHGPRFLEITLEPQTLALGGVELAPLGARYDAERFAAPFKKACEEGKPATCAELGGRYAKGAGVPRDPARAAGYFEKACAGGHPSGCLGLAELVERGEGRPRDLDAAVRLYRKACERGEPFACEQLRRLTR